MIFKNLCQLKFIYTYNIIIFVATINLCVKDLYMKYFGGYLGVDMVSFDYKGGGMAILGKMLSGKTSLLRCIAGLEDFDGKIDLDAKDIVFTFDIKSLKKNSTVYDTIAFPLTIRKVQDIPSKVSLAAKTFMVEDILKERIKNLNDDQKRLVILARAFSREADLYLLDNPLEDMENRQEVYKILQNVMKGKNVIYATDSLDEAKDFNSIMLMAYKKCIGLGAFKELIKAPKTLDVLKLLTDYRYEYLTLNKDEKGYNVIYNEKRIDVNEPISAIYDSKEVVFPIDNGELLNMYFDNSTEYLISKR